MSETYEDDDPIGHGICGSPFRVRDEIVLCGAPLRRCPGCFELACEICDEDHLPTCDRDETCETCGQWSEWSQYHRRWLCADRCDDGDEDMPRRGE